MECAICKLTGAKRNSTGDTTEVSCDKCGRYKTIGNADKLLLHDLTEEKRPLLFC